MWYKYTCGHVRCAPNYRSNVEKSVNNPCDVCRPKMNYQRPRRVAVTTVVKTTKVSLFRKINRG